MQTALMLLQGPLIWELKVIEIDKLITSMLCFALVTTIKHLFHLQNSIINRCKIALATLLCVVEIDYFQKLCLFSFKELATKKRRCI